MNAVLDHLAVNWGNWASVAGLFASLGSYVKAKAAATAAVETKNQIQIRSIADDFGSLSRMAAQLAELVQQERTDAAQMRVADLRHEIGFLLSRRDHLMDDASRGLLVQAQEQLRTIESKHDSAGALAQVKVRKHLVAVCPSVRENITAGHGHAARSAERN